MSTLRHQLKETEKELARLERRRATLEPQLIDAVNDHEALARLGAELAQVAAAHAAAEERSLSDEASTASTSPPVQNWASLPSPATPTMPKPGGYVEGLASQGENDMGLTDALALVTGGGRGIGRSIALALAEDGADVAITYHRDEESAADTVAAVEALGRRAVALQGAIDVEGDNDRVAAEVAAFGTVDLLVHNSSDGAVVVAPTADGAAARTPIGDPVRQFPVLIDGHAPTG